MKKTTIQNINTIGKVSCILLRICNIVLIIGVVCLLVGGIGLIAMPDDIIQANGQITAEVALDTESSFYNFGDITDNIEVSLTEDFGFLSQMNFDIEESAAENGKTHLDISAVFDNVTTNDIFLPIIFDCFVGAVRFVLLILTFTFAQRFAHNLQTCSTPFSEEIVESMRKFAFSMIPLAVFSLLEITYTSGVEIMLNLSIEPILIAAAILLVSYIFDFGAQLQRESDETL